MEDVELLAVEGGDAGAGSSAGWTNSGVWGSMTAISVGLDNMEQGTSDLPLCGAGRGETLAVVALVSSSTPVLTSSSRTAVVPEPDNGSEMSVRCSM